MIRADGYYTNYCLFIYFVKGHCKMNIPTHINPSVSDCYYILWHLYYYIVFCSIQ